MKVIGAILCVLAANFCFSEGATKIKRVARRARLTVEWYYGKSIYIESGKIKTWFPCSGGPTSKWASVDLGGCEMSVARFRRSRTNRNMTSYRALADVIDRDCLTKTLCDSGKGFTGTKDIFVKTRRECGNIHTKFCGYARIYTFKTTFRGVRHKQNKNHHFLSLNIEKVGGGRKKMTAVLNGGSVSLQATGTVTMPCEHVNQDHCYVNAAFFAEQGLAPSKVRPKQVKVKDNDCAITNLCYKQETFTGSKTIEVKIPELGANGRPTGSYKNATTHSAYFGWILEN